MPPRPYVDAADDDDERESEALILHRLDTDPRGRPIVHTIPSTAGDDGAGASRRKASGEYGDDDDDDDDLLMPPPVTQPRDEGLEKTGRPEWLQDGIVAARRSWRFRLILGIALLFLLAGVFAFAFGPSDVKDKVYSWAGDKWRAGKGGVDGFPYTFPTDVGYPGPTATGKAPSFAELDTVQATPTRGAEPIETRLPNLKGWNAFEHMGPLTPYIASDGFGVDNAKYRNLPAGCRIEQVHILHRHGSRYPTTGSPVELIRDLVSSKISSVRFTGPLDFLNSYTYSLGRELLVPLGRKQLYDSGVTAATSYGHLVWSDLDKFGKLLIRAGSQQRIVDSAMAFMGGLLGNNWLNRTNLEVQIEAPGFNTTLASNFACPNADKRGSYPGADWSRQWQNKYLQDAVKRLQPHAQGVELTPHLLFAMQQLCSYDTVAFGYSAACQLFTKEEWLGCEYAWDLQFDGSYGAGSPVGKAQGVGWVNEFMARFQGRPWDPSTQTSENSTLASHNRTFPVDRAFYADFTHDSSITGVLAAMGLPDFTKRLEVIPASGAPDEKRSFRTSAMVPYAARLVFEKLSCPSPTAARGVTSRSPVSFVRMLLNDAVVPLKQYPACEQDRDDGLCSTPNFLSALADVNSNADWQNCTRSD